MFFLTSQELLESTNKHEKSQAEVSRNTKQDFWFITQLQQNQDCKDQTKVKHDANSNLLIWIFWITSCYLKLWMEVKKELPKWCYVHSRDKKEEKKKSLKKLKISSRALPPALYPHFRETVGLQEVSFWLQSFHLQYRIHCAGCQNSQENYLSL